MANKLEQIKNNLCTLEGVHYIEVDEVLRSKRVWRLKELPVQLVSKACDVCSDEYSVTLVLAKPLLSHKAFSILLKEKLGCDRLSVVPDVAINEELEVSLYYLTINF